MPELIDTVVVVGTGVELGEEVPATTSLEARVGVGVEVGTDDRGVVGAGAGVAVLVWGLGCCWTEEEEGFVETLGSLDSEQRRVDQLAVVVLLSSRIRG
jgi:hypothetical protein